MIPIIMQMKNMMEIAMKVERFVEIISIDDSMVNLLLPDLLI